MIRRNKHSFILLVTLIIVGVSTYTWNCYIDHSLARHTFFTMYNDALDMYSYEDERREPPTSLDELENDYNTCGSSLGNLPMYDRWPRPEYRPAPMSPPGELYRVLIERKSPYWYDWGTYITLATPDGAVRECRVVNGKELIRLLNEDSAKRRSASIASNRTE